jgi:hypothetical protein
MDNSGDFQSPDRGFDSPWGCQFMTEQEEIYYADYALIEICDCCGDYFSLSDIKFNGKQFLCNVCRSSGISIMVV